MTKTVYSKPQLYVAQQCGTSMLCSSADGLNYRDDWGTIFNDEED